MVGKKRQLGAHATNDGTHFEVWAPFAKAVALLVDDNGERRTIAMDTTNDGYYELQTKDVHVGQNYHYLITTPDDRQLERNDPYARRLTSSNNGWSIVTRDEFDWSDDSFTPGALREQVIYELHVGTFNRPDPSTPGTFDDVIEKLDYLKDLGVTAIELMPVTSMMDDAGWGYAPTHIFSIEGIYGGRRGLMELVKAAHQHGLAVIVDMVYNHVAPRNELWQFDGWNENDHGGIYFYNDERRETPWGDRPDYGRPEVRDYLLANISMWFLEFHVDGLRLDATYYMDKLRDASGRELRDIPDGYSLLQAMTQLARSIKPASWMIAEDVGYSDNASSPSGLGFTAQWATHFPLALRAALGIDTAQNLDVFISDVQHYFNDDAFQKIIYSDSHDSAANGHERLNEEAAHGGKNKLARQKAVLASALTFTSPGVPMILQGEEFIENGYFTGWRELDWQNSEQFVGLVTAYRDLIGLRRNLRSLRSNGFQLFHVNYNDAVLGYGRWSDDGTDDVLVLVNLSHKSFGGYEFVAPKSGRWEVVFNSSSRLYSPDFTDSAAEALVLEAGNKAALPLDSYQAIVFKHAA